MERWPFLACLVVACGSEPQDARDSGADATTAPEHAPSVMLTDGGIVLHCIEP